MGDHFLCAVDQTCQATVLCLCSFPPVLLCDSHIPKHLSELLSQGCFHSLTSTASLAFLQSKEFYKSAKQWMMVLNERQSDVKREVSKLKEYQSQLSESFESAREHLRFKKESYEKWFSDLSSFAEQLADQAISETSMNALDQAYVPNPGLAAYIRDQAQSDEALFEFRVEIDLDRVESGVKVSLLCKDPNLAHCSFESASVDDRRLSQSETENTRLREMITEEQRLRESMDTKCREMQREKEMFEKLMNESKREETRWKEAFVKSESNRQAKEAELKTFTEKLEEIKGEKEAIQRNFADLEAKMQRISPIPQGNPIIPAPSSPHPVPPPIEESKSPPAFTDPPYFTTMQVTKPPQKCLMCNGDSKNSNGKCQWCEKWISKTMEVKQRIEDADAKLQMSIVWACSHCKTVNSATILRCNLCRKPRKGNEEIHPEQHWRCSVCGTDDNFEDDSKCYSCGKARISPEILWTCSGCGSQNQSEAKSCLKCSHSRDS